MSLYESTPRLDLPVLPDFVQLSDRVWRVMGLNPGKFTLQGTNTYLVGLSDRKVLIDSGEGHRDYVPLLIRSLKSIHPNAYISDIFISHFHSDHSGGVQGIVESDLNSKKTLSVFKYPLPTKYLEARGIDRDFPPSITVHELRDNQIFTVDEHTHLRCIHTPGHTKDHCSFYLEEENAVFTADCILGHGTVAFEDLLDYMYGLQRVKDLNPIRLYPGHGPVVDNAIEKIDEYISLRKSKENQILEILERDPSVYWSALDLVEKINEESNKTYGPELLLVVVRAVGLNLIKLYFDGKTELVDAKKIEKDLQIDPYDSEHIMSIVTREWKYIGNKDSKTKKSKL